MGEDDDHQIQDNPKRQKTEGYEDLSKFENFSERITTVKGINTGIFWDVEDYPFPFSSSPDEIYHKLESALYARGCKRGFMSIWVYVDEKKGSRWCEFVGKRRTWKSRIYFIGGGDKPARLTRMLHDILFWTMDTPVGFSKIPPHLFVFAEKVLSHKNFYQSLEHFRLGYRYIVFLFTEPSEPFPTEISEWPGDVLDDEWHDFDVSTMDGLVASDHGSEDKKADTDYVD